MIPDALKLVPIKIHIHLKLVRTVLTTELFNLEILANLFLSITLHRILYNTALGATVCKLVNVAAYSAVIVCLLLHPRYVRIQW